MELITGKTGLPHVYAADDAELYRLFLGDGAFVLPTGNKLNAEMNGAQELRLYDGSMIMRVDACKVEAVDTTAAGDTYSGVLASCIAEGKSLIEAVREANVAAAISVTLMGAQPAAPTRAEINEFKSKK
jgi:sugar/nucleoside kinase (ribokinase family)